ncbi:hypothetical protein F4803DRAFT_526839 [Xylaria telfairii]|nr:hypothetical protein F4803DRAFT_526839 [Xylaria telfairii]
MAEAASTLLVSRAAELSEAIFGAVRRKCLKPSDYDCYRVANNVAAKLYLINTYLSSLPPYWIDLEVEQLCRNILQDSQIITQPTKRPSSRVSQLSWVKPTDCPVSFFKAQKKDAQDFENNCDNLINKLAKYDSDVAELPDSVPQLTTPEVSDDLNNSVFEALQLIALCDPASHGTNNSVPLSQNEPSELRHPARLCLHETENKDVPSRDIAILVSAMDMAVWQEFCLKIHLRGTVEDEQQVLDRGGFCPIIERDITARLFLEFKHNRGFSLLKETQVLNQILQAGPGVSLKSVLRLYKLTPKDKVVLSYAIAHSYWKFYDSELMRIKWTSDTIWFMPQEDGNGQKDELPLCAYLSLPFGLTNEPTPDITYRDLLNHRCPRIFDLGILLLEIGLAKPFLAPKRIDEVAQANINHKIAIDGLLELETMDWGGFTNKQYFDSAVKFCLSSENFITSRELRNNQQGSIGSAPTWNGQAGVLKRRRLLQKNVVRPLAWLAKKGFETQSGGFTNVSKKPRSSPQGDMFDTILMSQPEALFHSNIIPKMWLMDLKKISEQVERKRRECRATTPVRVAILDTGLNRDFPAFKANDGLIKSITDEKDFVNFDAPAMMDTFGHGTFMARLIMECAPGAEILVARVAENTNTLQTSQENVKKAILWAGQTGKADIISMSFGFPADDPGIRDAVETVYRNRGEDIIFLASAGNSSTDDESFPARHPDVISVHATNCHGTFLQSNSASTTYGTALLGTYGDDIPDFIRDEFSVTYPKVCQPGSSVATAVMAGISATMLAYASVLPSLVPFQGVAASTGNRVLKRLKTAKGMEAVLHRLTQNDFDHPRFKAVKPMWFWKSRPTDTHRYCAVVDVLSDVDRRSPRMT